MDMPIAEPSFFVELSVAGVPVSCLLTRHSSRKYRVLFRSSVSVAIYCPGREAEHDASTNLEVSIVFFRVRARFSPRRLRDSRTTMQRRSASSGMPMKDQLLFCVILELLDDLGPATEKVHCRDALSRTPYNKPLDVNYPFSR